VSQAHGNARMYHSIHPAKSSQDKEMRHLILVTAKIEHQMDIIDFEVETKDAKILTLWLSIYPFQNCTGE
jgi:hypothetical protein